MNVKQVNFTPQFRQDYLDYSVSAIQRAIPDVRDGLKPVHRRILYAMFEGGYLWDKSHKKSAKIVGDVLGKYHPHGDSSIYQALVRMAQDFSMSICLVDGQGNFGSIDGDSAASMRYTESRLMRVAKYLLEDVDKECVDMTLNYDDSLYLPKVLPAEFPNLLVNGSTGIAVGMATSIPTHNLHEVIDAVCAYIDNPEITLEEIIEYIPGPDFPTGGIVSDQKSIMDIYRTGSGKVSLRGCADIDEENNVIIITEIPYQVNKSKLITQIADLASDSADFSEINQVRDESSAEGIRIVLELKRNSNAEIICRNLFKSTDLRINFHVHMLALQNKAPKTFSLLEIMRVFVDFRDETVVRRTLFYLQNAKSRAQTLIGFILAMDKLNDIIGIVRTSSSVEEAKQSLMCLRWYKNEVEIPDNPYEEMGLSEGQVKSILDMRLQSLTRMEQNKIKHELEEVLAKIKELNNLLDNKNKRMEIIKNEMSEIKKAIKAPRKTKIEKVASSDDELSLIANEECVVTLSHSGYMKRVSLESYRNQRRGGRGKQGAPESDPIEHMLVANSHSSMYLFSNTGYVYSIPVYKIEDSEAANRGRSIANFIELKNNEKIAAAMAVANTEDDFTFVFVTSKGYIRRNKINDFSEIRKNGKIAIKLDEGEHLAAVLMARDAGELLVTSSAGKSARISVSDIRVFASRTSRGVIGMSLNNNEEIVSVSLVESEDMCILTVTERGFGKRAKISDYRSTNRGAKGVISTITNNKTGPVIGAYEVSEDDEILLMNSKGQIIRCSVNSVRITSRRAEGVHLAKLDENDKITQMFVVKQNVEDKQ